jgi:hypothetical protein
MTKMSFNPLAAGSIPARPTSKIKGFQRLQKKTFFHFSPNLAKLNRLCEQFAIIFIIFLTICLLNTPARAEYKFADNWTWKDTAWQTATVVAIIWDWSETRYIVKHPDKHSETNIVLGSYPSMEKVDIYFSGCIITHTLISMVLPPKLKIDGEPVEIFDIKFNPRRCWQVSWFSIEIGYGIKNIMAGVRFEF